MLILFKAESSSTLFVKNLPYSATEDELKEMFDGCTEVRMPQSNGQSKGFAFVEFATSEEVDSALEDKQGAELQGRSLYLDRCGGDRNRQQNRDHSGSKGGS